MLISPYFRPLDLLVSCQRGTSISRRHARVVSHLPEQAHIGTHVHSQLFQPSHSRRDSQNKLRRPSRNQIRTASVGRHIQRPNRAPKSRPHHKHRRITNNSGSKTTSTNILRILLAQNTAHNASMITHQPYAQPTGTLPSIVTASRHFRLPAEPTTIKITRLTSVTRTTCEPRKPNHVGHTLLATSNTLNSKNTMTTITRVYCTVLITNYSTSLPSTLSTHSSQYKMTTLTRVLAIRSNNSIVSATTSHAHPLETHTIPTR